MKFLNFPAYFAFFLFQFLCHHKPTQCNITSEDFLEDENAMYLPIQDCTTETADKLAKLFRGPNPQWWNYSNCPTDTWMENISPCDIRSSKTFVNIGINKGS